ncbi:O-antigen polymerase [Sphingobacterium zeae]|uniref:O-antigen polymerase n=1 Tax=Sphingobacterium zeae TaxID=1776859 RepID=A0ABU0U8F0_9SPHI|nr:O-antigen ligase family protein [Sphingobacterium zeae]MDQ1151235.1 O-antigen polymerase [Sphingobacterium zeae]
MLKQYSNSALLNLIFIIVPISVLYSLVLSFSSQGNFYLNSEKVINTTLSITVCIITIAIQFTFQGGKKFQLPSVNVVDILVGTWTIYLTVGVAYFDIIHNEKFYTFSLAILFYFLARIIIPSCRKIRYQGILNRALILLSLLQIIIVLLQYLGYLPVFDDNFKVTGTFKNPAPLALFLCAIFPVSLSALLFSNDNSLKTISIINVISTASVLFVTQNRASLITVLLISLIMIFYRYQFANKLRNIGRRTYLIVLPLSLTLVVALFYYLIKYKVASSDGRLLIWKISTDIISRNPFFGTGYGSFKLNYTRWQVAYFEKYPQFLNEKYLSDLRVRDIAGYVKISYNEYLEMILEQGIIGFLIFVIILSIVILRYIKINKGNETLGYFFSIISILITGLFSYPFYSLPTLFLFTLLLAIVIANSDYKEIKLNRLLSISIVLLLVGVAIFLCFRAFHMRKDQINLLKAETLLFNNDPIKAEIIFEKLADSQSGNPDYLLNYGKCLYLNRKLAKAKHIFIAALSLDYNPMVHINLGNLYKEEGNIDKSDFFYRKAILINPSHLYPKYLLFKLYYDNNLEDESRKIATEIINSKIKVRTSLSEEILKEVNRYLRSPRN